MTAARIRYVCPTCRRGLTLHAPPTLPPTCAHLGTAMDARKASAMVVDDPSLTAMAPISDSDTPIR